MKRNTTIKIDGGIAYIDLTLGQVAMIDVSDIDLIKDKTWRALEKDAKMVLWSMFMPSLQNLEK